jgi:hypothetical protein
MIPRGLSIRVGRVGIFNIKGNRNIYHSGSPQVVWELCPYSPPYPLSEILGSASCRRLIPSTVIEVSIKMEKKI